MRKFARAFADSTAQVEALRQVQIKTVGISVFKLCGVIHVPFQCSMVQPSGCRETRDSLHSSSDRDEFSHAMSVAPPTPLGQTTDVLFQVSLGNDHETKAFYVPELTSNALRVSESKDDPSIVVGQLMNAATRAQAVCRIDITRTLQSYV